MRRVSIALLISGLLGVAVWALSQAAAPARSMSDYVPAGPILYLESRDFGSLMRDWNSSAEKRRWLESANFQVFSRSRLGYRLQQAQQEFAAAAGFPPDLALAEAVAGGESALAVYDIGQLEFLYVTLLPSARAMRSALWQARGSFQPRNAAGQPYFVRTDPASGRVAAFASVNDFLVLGTREDLVAGALALIAQQQPPATVKSDAWFTQSVGAAGQPGELRLVLNMPALVRSPHFRSYWIQRNVAALRQYSAGIIDLRRAAGEVREERLFLRAQPASAAGGSELGRILRLVPAGAGLYRAWVSPSPEAALEALEQKVLAPFPGQAVRITYAPSVTLNASTPGSESDLETNIDEAPPAAEPGRFSAGPLARLIGAAKPGAMLVLHASRAGPQGVFVGIDSSVVLVSASPWQAAAVRDAVRAGIGTLYTTSALGLNWVERREGAQTFHEIDGLANVAVAVDGNTLIVANGAAPLRAVLQRLGAPAAQAEGVYAAGFRHGRELPNFSRMMQWMDHPAIVAMTDPESPDSREPQFFSENIAGLGRVLGRLDSASITVRDAGPSVSQTVVYRLNP